MASAGDTVYNALTSSRLPKNKYRFYYNLQMLRFVVPLYSAILWPAQLSAQIKVKKKKKKYSLHIKILEIIHLKNTKTL